MQAVTKKDIEVKYSKGDQNLQEAPSLQQQAADYLQKEVLAPAEAYSGQSLDQKLQGLTPNYTQVRRFLNQTFAAGGAHTSLVSCCIHDTLPMMPTITSECYGLVRSVGWINRDLQGSRQTIRMVITCLHHCLQHMCIECLLLFALAHALQ